jgi:hypothetical protein
MKLRVTDLFADLDKIPCQFPKPLVLFDLLLRLLDRCGGNDFGNRLASYFPGKRVAGAVAGRIRFGAMTSWFAAFAKAIHQGPRPKIIHLREGKLKSGAFALQIIERWGQGASPI